MRTISRGAVAAAFALLSGCAEFQYNGLGRPSFSRPRDYYARSDLDELLRFGSELARKTRSARAEECRTLLDRQHDMPNVGVQLHLLAGRLLSDACGDARKISDSASALPPASLPDPRVRWWVAAQVEALKRLSESKRLAVVERKPKMANSVPASQKDEARVLREKLEAIRSIERRLDEVNGGK